MTTIRKLSKIDNKSDEDVTGLISYTEIGDKLGYKKKESVQNILANGELGFVEGVDYKFKKIRRQEKNKPTNEIYMTLETIKAICLTAPTKEGQIYRMYVLNLEKILRRKLDLSVLNQLTNPIYQLNKYELDTKNYKNIEIFYLVELEDEFLTGTTKNISEVKYTDIVKLWVCIGKSALEKADKEFKLYVNKNKIVISKDNLSEVIRNIDLFVTNANKQILDENKNVIETKNKPKKVTKKK